MGYATKTGREAQPAVATEVEAVMARVSREHAMLRALLDDVERACGVARELHDAAHARLLQAVWSLYLTFAEHLAMEEAQVAPLLRSIGASGELRAVEMILEHNEQRRLILELVEDCERESKAIDGLVAQAATLVAAFRADMAIEERSLPPALSRPGADA